jgi:hypothetical protein
LGDLIEFRHGPERDALNAAREPLSELGAALRPGSEVLIVPGNHDHHLLSAWLARRGRTAPPPPLGLESQVDVYPTDALAQVRGWLAPATVRTLYPGVWLRRDVYATHGHYADLHLTIPTLERLAAGVMSRVVRFPDGGPRSTEQYETTLVPIYAWNHALAQRISPELGGWLHNGSVRGWRALTGSGRRPRQRAMSAAFPAVVFALNRAGIGPLRADLSGAALRRAGLRGFEESLRRVGVGADYVVFGHTHRAGPLPGDDPNEWRTAPGARLVNSGCWVDEPSFLGPDPSRSPYRVGFAVWLGEAGAPKLVNLLDPREGCVD